MSINKQFFPALTGYRAIAAWMIFVYHFMPFNNPKYPEFAKHSISTFHIGVEMFFVLSGFLITYRYFNDYPIHFKKYMVNRFARIYPMYFFITVIVFLVWFLQNDYWTTEKTVEAVLSFTLLKAFFLKYNFAGIAQGWTLTLEEMFYITAPLFFILIRKSRWNLVILPVLIFILGIFLKHMTNIPENKWGFLQDNFSIFIFDFFVGIGLAYFILNKKVHFSKNWVTWLGFGFILIYIVFKHYLADIIDFKTDFGSAAYVIFLSLFGIAPLIWGLIHEKTIIQRILSSRFFILLGKSSYIFYLIHKGILPVFISNYISDNMLLIFILINIISIVLFTYVEEPLNLFIRNKFGKRKSSSDSMTVVSA